MNTHITNNPIKSILTLFLLVLCLPLSACAATLSSDAIEGKVLEEGTSKPISGATVVVLWTGHAGYSGTVCEHVETVTTDEQGHYRIPAWRKTAPLGDLSNRQWVPIAYKPGYEATSSGHKSTVYLKPFTGTRGERMEYLMRLSGLVGCYSAGDEKPLVPAYKLLYDEAKAIASSDNDKNMLHTIRRRALYAWSRPSREMTSREIEQAINNDPYLREQFQ